ncbi:MAG: ATP-binding protein [Acidimicrobiia bacterium]
MSIRTKLQERREVRSAIRHRAGGIPNSTPSVNRLFYPPHGCTTAHLMAAYPFMSAPGIGARGVYIGQEVAGASFCFDPWELYTQGLLTNPNMLIAGQVGRGKSSLVKSLLIRQQVFGRKAAVLDPKGEYTPLAEAIGSPVVKLAPGGSIRLNPLDPGPGARELDDDEVLRRQSALLQALVESSLGRSLRPEERTACDIALLSVRKSRFDEPTIPEVVGALLDPSPEAAATVFTTAESLALNSRDVALELRRLCEGDLRGMFDGRTNVKVDWEGSLVVLDLSALFASPALGLLMTCATAWLQAAISRPNGGKRFVVIDEAWAVLNNVGVSRWLQQSYKLSRSYGVSNVAVIHRLTDLRAVGAAGSEAYALAHGLLSDTETRIIYSQPHSEMAVATELLGLSHTESEVLPQLGRGVALWKVGRSSHLVQHRLGRIEKGIVDTDARMLTTSAVTGAGNA